MDGNRRASPGVWICHIQGSGLCSRLTAWRRLNAGTQSQTSLLLCTALSAHACIS